MYRYFINKASRFFVGYFCLILVFSQSCINFVAIYYPKYYTSDMNFVCTQLFGANLLVALLMISLCLVFKFCYWSWSCAFCELIFVVLNLFIDSSDIYNLSIQYILGVASVLVSLKMKFYDKLD